MKGLLKLQSNSAIKQEFRQVTLEISDFIYFCHEFSLNTLALPAVNKSSVSLVFLHGLSIC